MIELHIFLEIIAWWFGFGIIHTFFASEYIKNIFDLNNLVYRIIYNITNTITFLLVLYFVPSIIDIYFSIFDRTVVKQIFFTLIFTTGGLLTFYGLSEWNLVGFIGLEYEDDSLNTNGPYRISRHPVYTGIIIILSAALIIEISTITLGWFVGISGYFIVGSYFEENKLRENFGKEYRVYASQTGRLFPYKLEHFRKILNKSS